MADIVASEVINGTTVPTRFVDQGDGTYARKGNSTTTPASAAGTKSGPASVSVSTATQLTAASTRKAFVISNNDANNAIFIGKDNTVTTSNGIKLAAGAVFVDNLSNDAWFAIASTGTITVGVLTVS